MSNYFTRKRDEREAHLNLIEVDKLIEKSKGGKYIIYEYVSCSKFFGGKAYGAEARKIQNILNTFVIAGYKVAGMTTAKIGHNFFRPVNKTMFLFEKID